MVPLPIKVRLSLACSAGSFSLVFFGNVRNDFAVFQLDDAVAVNFCKLTVVRDDDDQFIAGQLFQRIEHLFACVRIERARRFICEDDLGIFDQRPRDGDALFLSARKSVGFALGKIGQLHLLQDLVDLPAVAPLALQFERERNVVLHRKFVEDVVFLKDEPDKGVAVTVKVCLRKVLAAAPLNDDLAFVRRVQSAA